MVDNGNSNNLKLKLWCSTSLKRFRDFWNVPPYVWRWRLLAIWIIGFSIAVGSLVINNRNQIQDLRKVKTSACAHKASLRKEIKKTKKFLAENPKGIPGISAQLIKDGLRDQRLEMRDLRVLDCKGEKIDNGNQSFTVVSNSRISTTTSSGKDSK